MAAAGQKLFSTTGRDQQVLLSEIPAEGAAPAGRRPTEPGPGGPAAELARAAGSHEAVGALPERLRLGGGWAAAATVGRHAENDAVLGLKASSKVHCQVALRSFMLPGSEQVHEALFLRDISKNGTLVGGAPAFRPWHWLQNGDVIGIRPDASAPNVLDLYSVRYCTHKGLPGHLVTAEEVGEQKAPPPAPAAQAAPAAPARKPARTFGQEVCGRVVDVRYEDPPATYRMRVISFDRSRGWHLCDSAGLSVWDGDYFTDEVPLNKMFVEGRVKFVDVAASEPDEDDGEAPGAKRARRGGGVGASTAAAARKKGRPKSG